MCANCALDVAQSKRIQDWHEEITCWNDGTILKVKEALHKTGLTRAECDDAVENMIAAGILFREKLPYI